MKVLVCISHVPDTTSKINFKENNTLFDTTSVQFVINPNDEFGLTRAIWLKEQNVANITVVTVGDNTVEPTLRKALAIGADSAIRIDKVPTDSYSVATELADLIKENAYDLVIMGRESIDYNGGAVPGMVSAILDYNFVNTCIALEVNEDKIKVIREIDGGKETSTTSLPLIIAGQKGLVEESDLKIPNMRGIMMARKKPLEVRPAKQDKQFTKEVLFEKPAVKGQVTLVEADQLDELIELLHTKAKVI